MKEDLTINGVIRWVSARQLAAMLGLHPQTLANWRSRDRLAGRDHAAPGKPVYRRFGSAVRYAALQDGTPLVMPPDSSGDLDRSDDSR